MLFYQAKRLLTIGMKVYLMEARYPFTITSLHFSTTPTKQCRIELCIPKRELANGERRRPYERLAEGSHATVHTAGLPDLYLEPPIRPVPVDTTIEDTEFDEIFFPEGYKCHGAWGAVR